MSSAATKCSGAGPSTRNHVLINTPITFLILAVDRGQSYDKFTKYRDVAHAK